MTDIIPLHVSKLVLGTVQMGLDYGINNTSGKMTSTEAMEVINTAHTAGVEYLDSAAAYGSSEEVIGHYNESYKAKRLKIITKLMHDQEVSSSVTASLDKLKCDKIDVLLFHSFEHYKSSTQSRHTLERLLSTSKVGRVGVSVYTNEEAVSLLNDPLVTIVQAPFNLLDNENLRADTFKKLKAAGKEVHTRSVFLQGLFFMVNDKAPTFLKPLFNYLSKLEEIVLNYQLSIGQLALGYALSQEYIDKVLIGVDSHAQLQQNLGLIEQGVPREAIEQVSDQINVKDKDYLNPSKWRVLESLQ